MKANQKQLLKQYLNNIQLNLSVAAFTKVSPSWKDFNYVPEFNRFYFIMEGEGRLQIGEEEFYPRPGQLFVMPAGVLQSYSAINENTFAKYWCHFTATIGDLNLFQVFELPYFIDVKDTGRLEGLFRELTTHYESGKLISVLRVKSILLEIIAYFIENAGIENIRLPASSSFEKLDLILKYIENHLAENITIEDLAKIAHFHPNYFIHFFKSLLGLSPIQYINKIKMEKAKMLLMTSDMSITEIAESVGTQLYYFSRSFKNYTGFAPSTFRSLFERG
jgi:AraC family transcriptional regulator of arabinose operon